MPCQRSPPATPRGKNLKLVSLLDSAPPIASRSDGADSTETEADSGNSRDNANTVTRDSEARSATATCVTRDQGEISSETSFPWVEVGRGGRVVRKSVTVVANAQGPQTNNNTPRGGGGGSASVSSAPDEDCEKGESVTRKGIKLPKLDLDSAGSLADKEQEENPNDGSSPLTPVGLVSREVKKLDSVAQTKQNDQINKLERSGDSNNDSHDYKCKGGSNKLCGLLVRDGEDALQCDKCLEWSHAACQGVSKLALKAIDKHHPILMWLCHECKVWLKTKDKSAAEATSNHKQWESLDRKITSLCEYSHSSNKDLKKLETSFTQQMQNIERTLKHQDVIIHNQAQLIQKGLKEQGDLKSSYANIVKGSCDKVVESVTKKMDDAKRSTHSLSNKDAGAISEVFDNFIDRDKRKRNLVVHNLPEQTGNTPGERSLADNEMFVTMTREVFHTNVRVNKSFRAGRATQGKPRLLILTLEDERVKHDLLRMAPQLRSSNNWSHIYLGPDLTLSERTENKALRDELKRRKEAGETNLIIYRKRIITRGSPMIHTRDAGSAAADHSDAQPSLTISNASSQINQPSSGQPQDTPMEGASGPSLSSSTLPTSISTRILNRENYSEASAANTGNANVLRADRPARPQTTPYQPSK